MRPYLVLVSGVAAIVGIAALVGIARAQEARLAAEGRGLLPPPAEAEMAPRVPALRFSGLEQEWPPTPTGRANEKVIPLGREIAGSLTIQLREQILTTSSQSPRVRELLGDRFGYIGIDEASEKVTTPSSPLVVVTFFSHTHNTAVKVHMRGLEILDVVREPDLQPHAGLDEVDMAVSLAQADSRLKEKVTELEGGGILVVPSYEQPGYGHRVLYVTFAEKLGTTPLYSAIIDLTDNKVLSAGTDGERQKR
jgi:hypothetical protein